MECRILELFCTGANGDSLGLRKSACAEYSIQYLQTVQLFSTTYKPYSCSHAAANHDYSAQVRVETHSACLRVRGVQNIRFPESAWSAEYFIKYLQTLQLFPTIYKPYSCSHPAENHDYSAQVRTETHSASLKVRGMQNI